MKRQRININEENMMTLSEFVDKFAEQFDETDPSEISAETRYRELDEWSSIIALSIMSMVDEEYDVTLRSSEIKNCEIVGELYEIVKGRYGN